MLQKFTKILREIMSEPNNGGLSWGRVASSIALLASLFWVTKVLLWTGHLPPLDGLTGYVTAPYLGNKAVTAAQSFSSNTVVKEVQKEIK